ncbi:MAG TPA: hypothetical protein VFF65_05280 [Phycisphaerales bacterium]|nr:hypothetical protein [Phycisphaerales bacterium]
MPSPPTPPPDAGPAPARTRPGKLFRRFRRTVRAVFIVLLLLPLLAVVLTQGPVPEWLIARSVRKATGAEFDASWVSLKLDGRFVATDAVLVAPASSGLTGEAARIAEAQRIEVVLDWSAWAAGVVVPSSVKVTSPVVHLSLDRATNRVNIARLSAASSGASSIANVPRIDVVGGELVIAEYGPPKEPAPTDPSGFDELVRLKADGWISPVFGTKRYLIRLRAANPEDPLMAFDAVGEVDLATVHGEVKTTALDLSRWTPDRVPFTSRELWEKLRLRGRISGTTVRYSAEAGLDTTLTLEDVSLNAPIASGRAEITGSRNPRMEGVAGTLRVVSGGPAVGLHADLRGLFEDLPARVRLDSRALSIDAAYSAVILAERFELEKDPRILWFTPEVVQRNFEKFSGPTAVIDARIEINRRPPESPGVPGETAISGTLVFENGSAAYELFPYPLVALSGAVRFDDEKVQIIGIQGRGPTGARFFAEGTIDPPTADSRYDIRVTVTDAPIDDALRAALLASKGAAIVDAVFSQKRFQELVDKGLLAPTPARGAPGAPAAPAGGPPSFEVFAGMIDSIQVHVTSGFGKEQPVHQNIAVRFKDVHALPEVFPYPLSGRDVSVRIGDDFVLVRGEGLTGVHGGTADLDARIDIVKKGKDAQGKDQWDYRPTIRLRTEDFPIEPLLINAIPDQIGSAKPSASGPQDELAAEAPFSIKAFLSTLHLEGPVDADISVVPGERPGDAPRASASVVFEGVSARPDHTGPPQSAVAMEGLIGAVRVSPGGLAIDTLEGRLLPAAPSGADEVGPPVAAKFRIDGEWSFAPPPGAAAPADSTLTIAASALDLSLAVEDLLRPIIPGTADTVADLRSRHDPTGRADLTFEVNQRRDALNPDAAPATSVDASVTGGRNLQLTLGGQRIEIIQESGTIGVAVTVPPEGSPAAAAPARVSLRDLAAQLRLDGEDVGTITASGVVSVPQEAAEGRPASPLLVHEPVDVTLRGLRLESPVSRQLAGRFGGTTVAAQVERYQPEGVLDGELRLAVPAGETDASKWEPWVAVRPRWLAVTLPEDAEGPAQRLLLPLISGEVTIEPGGGLFDQLTVVDEGWSARFNGVWAGGAGGRVTDDPASSAPTPWEVEGVLAFESAGLPPALRALLPRSIQEGLEGVKLEVLNAIDAPGIAVRVWSTGEGSDPTLYRIGGEAAFAGLHADPGVTIDDARGRLTFSAVRDTAAPGRVAVNLAEGVMRIAGLRITRAAGAIETAEIASSTGDGSTINTVRSIRVHTLTGEAYGGRLSLSADSSSPVTPAGSSDAPPATRYNAALQLAGVRFADVLHDLQRTRANVVGPRPPAALDISDDDPPPDGSRGLIEAQLAIRGTAGDAGSRSGRGEVRIAGGTAVLDVPGLTTLVSLAALQLPVSSPFDFAHADVHLEGSRLVFDRAAILSDSLALLGAGSMDIDTRRLDLRMAARGRARVPLLTDILDAFRDELFTARIRGTPDKPELHIENFSAVRAAFAGGPNPLTEALKTDLDRLERDRQRTLGVSAASVDEQVR